MRRCTARRNPPLTIVALKVVHEEAPTDHHERLVREARLLADLQHPSIVRYLAFGATDKGWPYLAMEWLDGEDLAMHLRGDGLDANDAIALATRVAEALGVAHERGIVHRDIKPSNLFLVDGEPARVKVLDFGVARIQLADDGVTRTGAAVGTPRYMSPEQARGSRDVDVRADVFALGCVLFECLTGRPAFSGANQGAVLAKILLEDAPRLSSVRDDLPPALDELLARMLAKQRDDRPRDGRAVAEQLAAIGALGETARRAMGGRDGAVTTGEQRLVCVVFAETALEVSPWYSEKTPSTPSTGVDWPAPPALPALDTPTQTMDPRRPAQPTQQLVRKLESIVAEHHARAEVMKDGSVVVTLSGRGAATDQAASAARCALALREVFPNTAMALAIGRSAVTDRTPYGDLIDRATAVLSRPPPEAVRQGMFPIYAQAWRALHDGDMVGALEFDQKVEHCFTEVGDLRQACRQHASVGYGQLMLGANTEAEKSLRESIAIATKIGLHQVTAVAQQNLGVALVRLGKIDEAREAERAALAACEAQQNFRHVASARNYLAEIELAAGNAVAAVDYARAAIADDSERPGFHCVYRARIATAHLLAGDTVAALDEATQAMQLMDTHGRPEEGEMVVRLAYARALHAAGDITDARTVIADTVEHITAIAARIGDTGLRQSFLDGVPEHAAALSLARTWGARVEHA